MAYPKEDSKPTAAHTEVMKDDSKRELERPIVDMEHHEELEAYQSRKLDFRTIMALSVSTFLQCLDIEYSPKSQALAFSYEACLFSFVLPAAILLTINAEIGPSANITWVATSWSLAIAVVQTIAGRCSDIFGRRNFFIAGNALGIIGEAITLQKQRSLLIQLTYHRLCHRLPVRQRRPRQITCN